MPLIGFRGLARVMVEDRGIHNFPGWFDALRQNGLNGPVPFSLIAFALIHVVLERSGFGRKTYVIGSNRDAAEFVGIDIGRHKMVLFIALGLVAAFAGLLYAVRVGAVRGGVSIFGGSGPPAGTLLAILIGLNLRNGMALLNITDISRPG